MSSIPKYMQVNKTPGNRPTKELINRLVTLVEKSGEGEYIKIGSLVIRVKWNRGWISRKTKSWSYITVLDSTKDEWLSDGTAKYLLCEYSDFTRMYEPGDWENLI